MSTLYIGCDIAKDSFVAAFQYNGQQQLLPSMPNSPAGFASLLQTIRHFQLQHNLEKAHLIIEPTAGYELALVNFCLAQGFQISLPNPLHVREWARGMRRRAKTDRQDAIVLARFGAETNPPLWQPLPSEVAELEQMLRRKEDLEQMLRQERNRQGTLRQRPGLPEAVKSSLERVIGALEQELADLEQQIKQHVRQHSELQEQARLLLSVPGLGAKNVLWVLVLLHRWKVLGGCGGESKGLVAYVGLDPKPHESGSSVHKRALISRMGNRVLRRRLFLSALGGIRGQNVLRAFYMRLVGRGKPKKAALIAAARKILVWAWAVFRDHTRFDPAKVSPKLAL
jgi:transposase